MTPPIPSRDELPFRRLERAHLNRVRCLIALQQAEEEIRQAISGLAEIGYDVTAVGSGPLALPESLRS